MKNKIVIIIRDIVIYFIIVFILFWVADKMGLFTSKNIPVLGRAALTTLGWHIGRGIVYVCRKKFGKKSCNIK